MAIGGGHNIDTCNAKCLFSIISAQLSFQIGRRDKTVIGVLQTHGRPQKTQISFCLKIKLYARSMGRHHVDN